MHRWVDQSAETVQSTSFLGARPPGMAKRLQLALAWSSRPLPPGSSTRRTASLSG
jgi:hypothetical protein